MIKCRTQGGQKVATFCKESLKSSKPYLDKFGRFCMVFLVEWKSEKPLIKASVPYMKNIFWIVFLFGIPNANAATDSLMKDLNTPRTFPKIETKAGWQERAKEIRGQILVSCGLWPLPEKTPLDAKVFGKIVRDGYSIEKVFFQSYPGFYVGGNLYRPLGPGKFPAILNPHGHWENGRMADVKDGSIAARCINFARQGMIAFSYDMVGYNDTFFANSAITGSEKISFSKQHRRFATNQNNLLWNINLMGLQTWNSIRALDFLESLPDVDPTRLACTGESGGGTQTFILGAIDDRLAAQAPVVMVSHSMQGGCVCENAPGLRVEYSNMEIAAVAAPRPQILIGATGDWTKTTMSIEGPAVESVYQLFSAETKCDYKVFDFPHNYNQTSREAVYEFFGRVLQPISPADSEAAYQKEPDENLLVFPGRKLPKNAVSEPDLIKSIVAENAARLELLKPNDNKSLARFKEILTPVWKHTMQLGETGEQIFEVTFHAQGSPRGIVVLADSFGDSAFIDESKKPRGLAKLLVEQEFDVLVLNFPRLTESAQNQVDLFFTTYNRTFAQERVRELVNACAWAKTTRKKVILCGKGRAGLWGLLASPAADALVADCDAQMISSDEMLLKADLFIPGLRKIGSFEGAAILSAPHPVLLHNTGDIRKSSLPATYQNLDSSKKIRLAFDRLSDQEIADWIARIK